MNKEMQQGLHILAGIIVVLVVAVLVSGLVHGIFSKKHKPQKKGANLHVIDASSGSNSDSTNVKELQSLEECIKVLRGEHGDTVAMVMVHRPGCPACTYTKPKYWDAAGKEQNSSVRWYAYSSQHGMNGDFIKEFNCGGVPSIYRIRKGSKREQYRGNRQADDLIRFASS